MMKKTRDVLSGIITNAVLLAMVIATLLVVIETFLRLCIGVSHEWAEELTRYLLIGAAIFITGPMVYQGGHICVDILTSRIKNPSLLWAYNLLAAVLTAAMTFFLTIWSAEMFSKFGSFKTPSLVFPSAFPYGILVLGVFTIFVFSVIQIIVLIRERKGGEDRKCL